MATPTLVTSYGVLDIAVGVIAAAVLVCLVLIITKYVRESREPKVALKIIRPPSPPPAYEDPPGYEEALKAASRELGSHHI